MIAGNKIYMNEEIDDAELFLEGGHRLSALRKRTSLVKKLEFTPLKKRKESLVVSVPQSTTRCKSKKTLKAKSKLRRGAARDIKKRLKVVN
jgi:hypothetical protein